MIIPVILCGGAGTRLWPASQDSLPKPFLPILDGASTLHQTLRRVAEPAQFAEPVLVGNREHRHLMAEAAKAADVAATLLLEPVGRDTAAAIAAVAAFVARHDPDAMLLILPADHLIRDIDGFRATVAAATDAAAAGRIVVFGIAPDQPATGYGYVRPGAPIPGVAAAEVAAFVEKPSVAKARRYLAAGYLWNSGMFLMRAATALAELEAFEPAIAAAARDAVASCTAEDPCCHALAAAPFSAAESKSLDYAVMERTARAAVVPARFDWSDVGTWSAVWDAAAKDPAGNVTVGEVVPVESSGCYIRTDGPLIGTIGVRDLIVVASNDAVLIAPRRCAGAVKELAKLVSADRGPLPVGRIRIYRPWGYYQSLDVGDRHQVKRLFVKPGARLSLQRHRHRSEHWTIVQGEAEVTIGASTMRLGENQSAVIPSNTIHRVANPGPVPLVITEVQYGEYLGEDDIERVADDYGRLEQAMAEPSLESVGSTVWIGPESLAAAGDGGWAGHTTAADRAGAPGEGAAVAVHGRGTLEERD